MSRWLVLAGILGGCGRLGFDTNARPGATDAMTDDAATADGSTCAGYVSWGALPGRYRLGAPEPSWGVAESGCEAEGAHLIVIESGAEQTEARARVTGEFWIGLTDRITEGSFLTVLGAAPVFSGWPGATPSNTGEDCVTSLDLIGDWEDRGCDVPVGQGKAFVCECDGLTVDHTAF